MIRTLALTSSAGAATEASSSKAESLPTIENSSEAAVEDADDPGVCAVAARRVGGWIDALAALGCFDMSVDGDDTRDARTAMGGSDVSASAAGSSHIEAAG